MPLVGAGSGGFDPADAERVILRELQFSEEDLLVKLVKLR